MELEELGLSLWHKFIALTYPECFPVVYPDVFVFSSGSKIISELAAIQCIYFIIWSKKWFSIELNQKFKKLK